MGTSEFDSILCQLLQAGEFLPQTLKRVLGLKQIHRLLSLKNRSLYTLESLAIVTKDYQQNLNEILLLT